MSFGLLNIASRSLAAQQIAMDVTGQNLANATTPGYQTETANLTPSMVAESGTVGAPTNIASEEDGVSVSSVTQASNALLTRSVLSQTSQNSQWQSVSQSLGQLQSLFQEPSTTGLAESMNTFFGAWQTLSQNPTSLSSRSALVGDSQQLVTTFHNITDQLTAQQSSLNTEVGNQVNSINALATQIADLNHSISAVQGSGTSANSLVDQQGQLLSNLSQIANITYNQLPTGGVQVYLGGQALVDNETTYSLQTVPQSNGLSSIQFANGGTPNIQSGSLAGILQVRGVTSASGTVTGSIPTYLSELNSLASGLASAVNTQQEAGYSLTGTSTSTTPFFTFSGSTPTAGGLTVNSAIVSNTNLIGAASSANAPGDGSNALTIADLVQQSNMTFPGASGPGTVQDYWTSIVDQVGQDGSNATNYASTASATLSSLQQTLQSQVGVDPNQQATQLIQEEQSYQAASKMVSTEQSAVSALLSAVS